MSETPRVTPIAPPFAPEAAEMLERWMGTAQRPPLALFRTLARNLELSGRMWPLGAGFLGRASGLAPREREIVIDRVCARCGCEYEWGVHAALFGPKLGISAATLRATVLAAADDPVWSEREALLVRLADELHDTARVSDALWASLAAQWSPAQCLELLVLAGWYHAIAYVANGARVPLEAWAARFPPA